MGKRSLRNSGAAGSGKSKPSVSAAPKEAKKDSAHHHTKWDDAKHSIKNHVMEMSKSEIPQEFILGAMCSMLVLCSCLCCCRGRRSHVSELLPSLKHDLKTELKDLLVKELKEALGGLQQKQTHLESTVTRMLMREVENF